jgi:hypothetical protein
MLYKFSEEQYKRFKKIIFRFLNKRYKETIFGKVGSYYVLRDINNKDDYVFEIDPREQLIMYDNLNADVIFYFGIHFIILEQILKDWVKERYNVDVAQVIF